MPTITSRPSLCHYKGAKSFRNSEILQSVFCTAQQGHPTMEITHVSRLFTPFKLLANQRSLESTYEEVHELASMNPNPEQPKPPAKPS